MCMAAAKLGWCRTCNLPCCCANKNDENNRESGIVERTLFGGIF